MTTIDPEVAQRVDQSMKKCTTENLHELTQTVAIIETIMSMKNIPPAGPPLGVNVLSDFGTKAQGRSSEETRKDEDFEEAAYVIRNHRDQDRQRE